MKVLKLLKRDFFIGIYRKGILFLIPILVAIAQCCECQNVISYLSKEKLLQTGGTILDYYMYCTKGMYVFHFDPKSYFTIPIYWFVFQIYVSYFIGYDSYQDFEQNGRNLFLAVKDRKSWWNSKCLWCVRAVVFNYMVFVLAIISAAAFWGAEWKLNYSRDFASRIFGANVLYMSSGKVLLVSLVLPCVITIGLCLLQIFVGFLITPVVSFACMCGIYVVSAYETNWFLLGNYTMWLRSNYVTEEGVHMSSGLILGVTISVCVWYIGKMYFEEKDIL